MMLLDPQEYFRIVVSRCIGILLPRQRKYHSRILFVHRRKLVNSIPTRDLDAGPLSPQSTGGAGMGLHIYTENVDSAFDRAIKAGATAEMPVADMFWGDRYGKLADPFGRKWSIATHKADLSMEEMAKGLMEQMPKSA